MSEEEDGVSKPQSYGKYDVFNTENDQLSWEEAKKRGLEARREKGLHDPDAATVISNLQEQPVIGPKPQPAEAPTPVPFREHSLLIRFRDHELKDNAEAVKWINEVLKETRHGLS